MTISEHGEEFAGLPIQVFSPGEGTLDLSGTAPRLSVDELFDDDPGARMAALLDRLLADPGAGQVKALVIGQWWASDVPELNSSALVAALSASSDRLPALRALFLGDITSDECEISWINQSDVTPLLTAFPALAQLRVRGGNGLAFGPVRHEALKALVIESGGLSGDVVRSVAASDLPNLEHLELWLGVEDYGGDATVEDLAPILSGAAFPRLKSLGLRDCEFADALAAALADAPVLRRIETLDLSLGTLGDDGVVALLAGGHLAGLRKLDIHHHYVSDEVLDGLKALGIELDAGDRQDPDYEFGRYVAVSE